MGVYDEKRRKGSRSHGELILRQMSRWSEQSQDRQKQQLEDSLGTKLRMSLRKKISMFKQVAYKRLILTRLFGPNFIFILCTELTKSRAGYVLASP